MKIIKRINGLWSFVDNSFPQGFEAYPFGCVINETDNTFLITQENRSNYPIKAINVSDIVVVVEPSVVEETFANAVALRNRLKALNFYPFIEPASSQIPTGIVIDKGFITTPITITPVANETHLYTITTTGVVNGTLNVNIGDVIAINTTDLWIISNNNQSQFYWIRESTPFLLQNTIISQKIFTKKLVLKPNKRYMFKFMFGVTGITVNTTMGAGFEQTIETVFRYGLGGKAITNYTDVMAITGRLAASVPAGAITGTGSTLTAGTIHLSGEFTTSSTKFTVNPFVTFSTLQATSNMQERFFICWEIGNAGDSFNGDFINN